MPSARCKYTCFYIYIYSICTKNCCLSLSSRSKHRVVAGSFSLMEFRAHREKQMIISLRLCLPFSLPVMAYESPVPEKEGGRNEKEKKKKDLCVLSSENEAGYSTVYQSVWRSFEDAWNEARGDQQFFKLSGSAEKKKHPLFPYQHSLPPFPSTFAFSLSPLLHAPLCPFTHTQGLLTALNHLFVI